MKRRAAQNVSTSEFFATPGSLAADDVLGAEGADSAEDLGFFVVHGAVVAAGGWLHREECDDLEEVVLDDVAEAACGFVEGAAVFDAEGLGEGDLDGGDVVAVPDGFEEGVGEAEVEDVHDRFLAEEVIDAEDGVFGEDGAGDGVEPTGGGEVAAEGLFDDDAGVFGEAGGAEVLDHRCEERGWDGEVVCGSAGACEGVLDGGEGGGVVVVAADVGKTIQEGLEGAGVFPDAGGAEAGLDSGVEAREGPFGEGDADDGEGEVAAPGHGVEGGEGHFEGEVAGDAEEDEGVGAGGRMTGLREASGRGSGARWTRGTSAR